MIFSEYLLTYIFIFLILWLLYQYSKRGMDYWQIAGVKYVKPLPVFGNFASVFFSSKCLAEFHWELYRQHPKEKCVGYYQFLTPTLILKDPEIIRSILIKDAAYFYDRITNVDSELNPLDNHLAALKGQQWKTMRSKLSTVFTSSKIKIMYDQMSVCIDELCKVLEKSASQRNPEIDVSKAMKKLILDITGSCIFGLRLDCLNDPNSEFVKMSSNVFSFSSRLVVSKILGVLHPSLPKILHFKEYSKEVEDFYINFVKDSVRTREENNVRRNDFLQLMIDLRNEDKAQSDIGDCKKEIEAEGYVSGNHISLMDDAVFAANIFIFFNAGTDTTGSALTFCLLELACNMDLQHKLYNEIQQTLEKCGPVVTYYDIKNLQYLEKVTSETLRKYPVGGSFPRTCTKNYKIPDTDVVIKEGVVVIIPSLAIHHDPEYYPDPERFDPERFSEEAKNSRPPCTYLPFGDGPRHCIAMRLALIEFKVALFKVLSEFEFRVCNKTKYPAKLKKSSMIVIPGEEVMLSVYKRKK